MANLADFGCGLCEWERRPVGTKHAELVRVKQCASCRLGSLRENAASSTGYEAVDAYRDAVLAAERQRLLALTPEAVVEAAAKAVAWFNFDGSVYRDAEELWEAVKLSERERYRGLVRAALPVLLAPEVARREQVERERDGAREDQVTLCESFNAQLATAEAEVARLRGELEKYGRHRGNCRLLGPVPFGNKDEWKCTCGYTAALAGGET